MRRDRETNGRKEVHRQVERRRARTSQRAFNKGGRNRGAVSPSSAVIDQRGSFRFEIGYRVVETVPESPIACEVADALGFCPRAEASKFDQATLPAAVPESPLSICDVAERDQVGIGAGAKASSALHGVLETHDNV